MKFHSFFSMVFVLTDEQEQLFREVLMYISNERKSALIQVLDSDSALSVSDSLDKLSERFPTVGRYITKNHIPTIFYTALSPLELAALEFVASRQARREDAKAFKLTEKGKKVKRYAAFALEGMAREFDQSIYPILGTMNSTYDNVRPQQAVRLLYLVNECPVRVQELIDDPSLTNRASIYDILIRFTSFKDGQGNAMPLVEIRDPKSGEGMKGYHWARGSLMPTTTRATERYNRLITTLSSNPDRVWTLHELARECGYAISQKGQTRYLSSNLDRLESKGNAVSGYSHELRTVHITDHGRRFISLLEPIRGDIVGDEVSKGIIDGNQPTPQNLVRALGLYVNIKNQERGYQPVA